MTNQNLERIEEKRAPNPAESMAKICLERPQSALFTVTGKYRKISNIKKVQSCPPITLHYPKIRKMITTTFTDFIAAGFLNRDFACTKN